MSVVGIDLGTTNTVVGCVRAGKVHVLADEKGVRLLPSVVSFHPNGEVLVGSAAKARRVIDARNTVYSHKRLIGRSWASPEITQARQRLPFELREGPGQGPLVHARGQDYTLPEVSAFVLKRSRQIAEQALGMPVDRAVITVPAHFNELQRASTKVAGRVSGLEVLRILNEPTAAALAYGLGRTGNERVAVYDFGGGTFDCTLLDLNGNVFEVLATAGDSFLGGDDVDNLIADRMAEAFLKQYRQDAKQDTTMFERLKTTAEDIKIALSTAETHTVTLKDFGHGSGGASVTFQFTMTRRDLDAMVTPLVDRSFKVTQDALSLARLAPSSFDKVILVGGSTRMPLVRRRVEAFFGSPPLDRVNPDEVVAIGAAIQAAALTEGVRRRSIPAPPGVPGRRSATDAHEMTQTSELDPAMLKAGATTAATPRTLPGGVGKGHVTKPGVMPTTQPFGARAPLPTEGETLARSPGSDRSLGDPETLTQASPASRVPPPPFGDHEARSADPRLPSPGVTSGRGPGFGSIDEPPSLLSSPSASIPSFPSMSVGGQPPGDAGASIPDGEFGALPDLSIVSSSGISTSNETSHDDPFGHVSDLSLIANQPGIDAITQARQLSFGVDAPDDDDTEAFRRDEPGYPGPAPSSSRLPKGNTVQLDPAANPAAPPPKTAHDSMLDREDLPAVVAKAKPARKPGHVGMSASGGAAMIGKPPPLTAPQPFSPMEKRAPDSAPRTEGMQTQQSPQRSAPPIPPAPKPQPNTTPLDARRQPLSPPKAAPPAPATNMFGSVAPQPFGAPAPEQAFAREPSAYPPPVAQRVASVPPPAPNAYPSASPHAYTSAAPPPMQQAFSQPPAPPQPYAYGSAAPPPMGGSGEGPIFSYAQQPAMGSQSAPLTYPPAGYGGAPGPGGQPGIQYQSPVLVDVTPRGLVVETAGGYTDTIIPRNAKIPCERTRRFATGRDMQTTVRVRVAQGESPAFHQNTYLGEVELSGLRPAPRGEVTVSVTFEVDADGTLRIRARDVQTGQEARATLQLVGVADESSVVMMINRFAQQPVVGGSSS